MVKDLKRIRQYRKLRRKVKRLRKRRALLRFILYKILPFAFLRVIFKKYYWITLILFLLSLFYKAGNQFSIEQSLKLKESQIELRRAQQHNKQQDLRITDSNKEILEWSQKYNKLEQINEQQSEKLKNEKNKIDTLNRTIEQFEKNNIYLKQEKKELELELNTVEDRLQEAKEKFRIKTQKQETTISQLELKITIKNNELELKQSEINNLKEKLENQKIEFSGELELIKQKIESMESAIKDRNLKDALQMLGLTIQQFLQRKIK